MNNARNRVQFRTEGSCVGGGPPNQHFYNNNAYSNNVNGGGIMINASSPQPVGGQYPIPPPSACLQQASLPPQYLQLSNGQTQFQMPMPFQQQINSNEGNNTFSAPPPPPPLQHQ